MVKSLAHDYAETFTGAPGDEVSYENATVGSVIDPLSRRGGSTGWAARDTYVGVDHFRLSDKGDTFVSFDTNVWVAGGTGVDLFYAGAGNDHFVGGLGDTVSYENADSFTDPGSGEPMTIDTFNHLNHGGSLGWAAGDTFAGIDHFRLSNYGGVFASFKDPTPGAVNDVNEIWVTGGAGHDVFYAGDETDHFDGGGSPPSTPLNPQGNTLSYGFATGPVTLSVNCFDPLVTKSGTGLDTWVNMQTIEGSTHDGDKLYSIDDGVDHLLIGDGSAGYSLTSITGTDTLYGARSANLMRPDGYMPYDTFNPQGGVDKIFLGARGNWIDYENDPHTGGIVVDLLNQSLNTGDAAGDTYLTINGDAITSSLNNTIALSLSGSDFNDSLYGTDGANHILGDPLPGLRYHSDGDDTVHGRGGDDTLDGIGGADALYGDDGADILTGGLGADALWGGAGGDTFVYQTLDDSTASGYDIIHDFDSGADHINLSGPDLASITSLSLIASGGGTFLFSNAVGGKYLQVGSTAPIQGSNLVLGAGVTTVAMIGDAAFNVLIGSGLNDTVKGAGAGDWLAGGSGADRFLYEAAGDSTVADPDSIFDFVHGADKLDLTALHLGASAINWLSSSGSTYVFIDANHDTVNDMLIQLNGTASLSLSDFLL
jgi:Ca2+-binding RTX toxin-like protein